MNMKMHMPQSVQDLFANYWTAKTELAVVFPRLSVVDLDTIATTVIRATSVAAPEAKAPEAKVRAPVEDHPLRYWVYMAMGQEPMRVGDIYNEMVRLGWKPTRYADARGYLAQLLNHGKEFERVGHATYVKRPDPILTALVQGMPGAPLSKVLDEVRVQHLYDGIDDPTVMHEIHRVIKELSRTTQEPHVSLRQAIENVLGERVLSIGDVCLALQATGRLPHTAHPRSDVGVTLAKCKKTFEPVPEKGRGFYRHVSHLTPHSA